MDLDAFALQRVLQGAYEQMVVHVALDEVILGAELHGLDGDCDILDSAEHDHWNQLRLLHRSDEGFDAVSDKVLDQFGRYCSHNMEEETNPGKVRDFFEVAMKIAAELRARRELDAVICAAIEGMPSNPKDLN